MKKNLILSLGISTLAMTLSMQSCSIAAEKQEDTVQTASAGSGQGVRIAYVEIDTLMSQYNFCKDYTLLMNKKGENIRATLASKERALQTKAAELQKKYETNQFTTKEQVEQAQMQLAKQQQDLQALNERLMNDFAAEQAKYNDEMRDSIQAFLKEYNKSRKFDYIISKVGDNLLTANPKYDITADVVKGLNKRYKQKTEASAK